MEETKQKVTIDISTTTIIKVIGILLILWFIYFVRDILAILFIAIILAAAIEPLVTILHKRKIPRALGVLIIYLLLFLIFSLVVVLLIPPITKEIGSLANNFPLYWEKIIKGFTSLQEYSLQRGFLDNIQGTLESLQSSLQKASTGVLVVLNSIFGSIVSLILILVITFYLVVQEEALKKIFRSIAPEKYQPYLINLFIRMQVKIGDWLKGQLILSLFITIFSLIGLWILGIKYALVLALIAGLFEFIPYLGPILGAIPAVFLAFVQSPFKALLVIILYVIIQQIENNILVPKIMQKTVGLNPIIIIVVLLFGAKLAGIVGAILAIPVATAISVVIKDFFEITRTEKKLTGNK